MAQTLTKQDDNITFNLSNYIKQLYVQTTKANKKNGEIIYDFIKALESEINIKDSTRGDKIRKLCWLSRHLAHKSFYKMTKQDILGYLNGLRKPESEDPRHKSIGTYNGRQKVLLKFFRWLYNQDEPDERKRTTPACMKGVKALPRSEKSAYTPEDIWSAEDHTLFLKYCYVPRDRCWHTMVHDTSARPHELLKLRIKDIQFKLSGNGVQYAEIHVHGKTHPRTLPLINSIPYVKEWLEVHPHSKNGEAPLFCAMNKANYGGILSRDGMLKHYQEHYRDDYFPKLLQNPSVPQADKEAIKLLLRKPWNLYIFRHSALTQKSTILKESTLRDYAGWTQTSKMPSVYIHYFGTESSNSLLEAAGIDVNSNKRKATNQLKPKPCPHCSEPNKPDSQFCAKCRMVLSYSAYEESIEKDRKRDLEIEALEIKVDDIQEVMQMYKEQIEAYKKYTSKSDGDRRLEHEQQLRNDFRPGKYKNVKLTEEINGEWREIPAT